MRAWKEDEDCETNARKAYAQALEAAGLGAELTEEEKENFGARFVEEMIADCKYDPDIVANWVKDTAEALEHQKPIVTEAFAASVNKADLGFTVEVRDYMKNESKTDFDNLLGMDEELADPSNISAESLLELEFLQIPETFDAKTKVPACAETIQRIHNQGTCGSCWAFGTLQAMDARLCISTNGFFSGPKAALSRGYTTSCSTPGGRNGCNGGWFSFVYNLMGEGISCDRSGGGCRGFPGIVTGLDNGCIPYFGHGSGVDHFNSKSSAPPCNSACVKTYTHRPLKQDLYISPGGGGWARNAVEFAGGRDDAAAQRARKYIYDSGPLPFAVMADGAFKGYSSGVMRGACQTRPNHCVTAFGYGKDYFDSHNSWGTRWGDRGGFKIADCLVTHWSVPPPMPTEGIPTIPGSHGPPAPGPAPGPPAPGPAPPGPSPGPAPPAPPVKPVWSVIEGECTVDGSGCMKSPNYRPGGEGDKDECDGKASKYPSNTSCTFDLLTPTSPAIEVVDFVTEKGFDIFTVNGQAFSGGGGDVAELQGLVPTGQMTFVADKGFEKTGFKLCPKDPRSDMVYVGPYKDEGGRGYGFYVHNEPNSSSPWPNFTKAGQFKSKTGAAFDIYVSSGEAVAPPSPGPAPPGPAPPGPAPPPSPGPAPPSPEYDDPDAAKWLQIHNYFRCIHNTPAIDWDKDVAAGSAEWAQKGQMSHSKCYKIPAPRGPAGENLAAGQADIEAAVTAWYDESPERGPGCGGHCTALLWKKSTALGCGRKNTWNGNRPMYVCRYAKSAANFGSKTEGVNMPDYSREEQCYGQYPVGRRWKKGGPPGGSGTLEDSQDSDSTDGQGEAVTDDEPVEEEDPAEDEAPAAEATPAEAPAADAA